MNLRFRFEYFENMKILNCELIKNYFDFDKSKSCLNYFETFLFNTDFFQFLNISCLALGKNHCTRRRFQQFYSSQKRMKFKFPRDIFNFSKKKVLNILFFSDKKKRK